MGPLLSRQPFPLNLRHASTTTYQSAELVDQPILFLRIVVSEILLQSLEEFSPPILLTHRAQTDERGNRLAHTCVNCLGAPFHLVGDHGRKGDAVPWLGLALAACFELGPIGTSASL